MTWEYWTYDDQLGHVELRNPNGETACGFTCRPRDVPRLGAALTAEGDRLRADCAQPNDRGAGTKSVLFIRDGKAVGDYHFEV